MLHELGSDLRRDALLAGVSLSNDLNKFLSGRCLEQITARASLECALNFNISFEGDVEIQRALEAGARGYLLKTAPAKELVEVIRQTHAGKKRIPAEGAAQLGEHMGG